MIYADKRVIGIADQAVQTKIGHASMIMRQIQEMAMSLRMVSVRATFQKMARLARDLAKKCGREIEFVTEGEETELDKSVVEKIGDPLIHMIRNSVDHGIESPADRALAGKPVRAWSNSAPIIGRAIFTLRYPTTAAASTGKRYSERRSKRVSANRRNT